MFSTGRRLRALEFEVRDLRLAVGQLVGQVHDLQSQSPSKLRAEFAELAAAVDLDRDSNKRQFGRLFAHRRHDVNGDGAEAVPAEIEALVKLQNSHRGT